MRYKSFKLLSYSWSASPEHVKLLLGDAHRLCVSLLGHVSKLTSTHFHHLLELQVRTEGRGGERGRRGKGGGERGREVREVKIRSGGERGRGGRERQGDVREGSGSNF